MIRYYDVSQLTTAELERAKRELQASLSLIASHSPAHVPIQAQMRAIDRELAARAESPKLVAYVTDDMSAGAALSLIEHDTEPPTSMV